MTPYITYKEPIGNNEFGYFIVQKEFPHYCGRILQTPEQVLVPPSIVAGYNLYVVFNFTIRGNSIPSYNNVEEEIQSVLEDMAIWFLDNRILVDEKKYKKLKVGYVTDTVK